MSKPKLLFFKGAGISEESGLETFRNSKNGFLYKTFNKGLITINYKYLSKFFKTYSG
jgi:NAD-dependent SIR2 family protein deacetylase